MKINSKASLVVALLFLAACQINSKRENLIYGVFGGTNNITEVRRIVIFPFPGNNQESKLFHDLAEDKLWNGRVVSQDSVFREMKRLNLDPKNTFISLKDATQISKTLRGDAFLIGYRDLERVLHVKIVNIATGGEWVCRRELMASSSIRMFVEELRANFLKRDNITYKSVAPSKILPVGLKLAILQPDNESTNILASEIFRKVVEKRFRDARYDVAVSSEVDTVLLSTFSVNDGGQLRIIQPAKLAEALKVDGLVYIVVHSFDYQNVLAYQKRKVSATIQVKDNSGALLWNKEIQASTGSLGLNRDEILKNVLGALAKQAYETAVGTQLFEETYAATEGMLNRPWWEKYGDLWDI